MGEDSENMDVDATQKYFADVGVDLSDVSSLIASTIVACPTMGQVSQEGFVKGWSEFG
jgi:DCN1-like protein 1/2